jgi:hypothetical protein
MRNADNILMGKSEGKSHMGDLYKNGRMILKWILKQYALSAWTEIIRFKIGSSGGLLWTQQ